MRDIVIAALLSLCGCATPEKSETVGTHPDACMMPINLILATPSAANRICRSKFIPISDKTGEEVPEGIPVLGCAGLRDGTLVATYDADTVMHEVRHFADHYCPWMEER